MTKRLYPVNIVVLLTINYGGESITIPREEALGYLFRTLANQVMQYTDKAFSQLPVEGLTPVQGWIGRYLLSNVGQDIFQKDIEENLDMSSPTTSRMLQLMEKNGFVIRENVTEDKRYKKILPTPLLMDISQQVKEELFKLEQEMRKGIEPQEMAAFIATIRKIQHNLDNIE